MYIPGTTTSFSELHPDDWEPYFAAIDEWRTVWAVQRPLWAAKIEGMPEDPGPRPLPYLGRVSGLADWQAKADRYFAWLGTITTPAFTEAPPPAAEDENRIPWSDYAAAVKRDAGIPAHRKYRLSEAHRSYLQRRTLIGDPIYTAARAITEQIRLDAARKLHSFDAPSCGFGYGGYDD